ncbi:unnamed protein product [Ilex paraguariensis]|uniref:Purple acid phosphatase n=1 Tax=Ilex paraguariensis TaxID=185542 RepID=A0ABC8R508_9AQUA
MGVPRMLCWCSSVLAVVGLVLNVAVLCNGGVTSSFVRKVEKTNDMPLDSDVFSVPPGYNAPQQVHITQGDHVGEAVIVSWVTVDEPGSDTVLYWSENSKQKKEAKGRFNTKYYYEVGIGHTTRTFWFTTPPEVGPDVPYTFGLIGDLGQSFDSNITLTHYEFNPTEGKTVLFVGDLSYADNYPNHDNVRWDTWGRFTERSAAYQPWIWTAGNHEIDFAPEIGETKPFKPYSHRYHVPYKASNSTAPFWYSIKRASAYIIVLSSYSAYGNYTPQYKWLEAELKKVNRSETPWLVVLMHSPWYNSYNYHYMEGETMRVMYEPWFVQYKVDVVFAGHVHAYERSERVSNIAYNVVNGICSPVSDQSAPVYITIGDGGNLEGLTTNMTEPQPKYSAFREASFGHAIFEIKNRTHAYYGWHRNQDGYAVEADSLWDTWGRFTERSAAYQPWIWTAGNHEIDFAPEIEILFPNLVLHMIMLLVVAANTIISPDHEIHHPLPCKGETKPFKPYSHRYQVPYKASNSTAPFWYSIKRASAYIIVLSSYSAFGKYTPQYKWLEAELPKVNRSETPWLIVLMHSPWYNSYNYHYMEGETMRVMYEPWFVQYKVDVVFAGHVHAYERSERVSNIAYNVVNGICSPVSDQSAPVYITIGDGGNLGGLATNMTEPQPKYSAFREASFGHAIFDIKNRTHAYYGWHRNQDGYAVEADSLWVFNRFWHPVDDSTSAQP